MRKNHHEEFISFKDKDGNVSNAFITGVPDKCQHDDDGEMMHFNDAGQYFKESELPKGDKERMEFMDKHDLRGGCVSCSKCGKPFEIDLFNCE
ncbi:MAG: hypothetical protein IPJ01_10870 [Micavibrio sp.]|nr:hypothetical protein [Micavibrio sp.]